eukprot:EG_transcript_7589
MTVSRWVTLVYSLLVGTCPSLVYAFGLYSEYLKASCHFTQQQLAVVSAAGNASVFFGLPAGLFYDRYGPRLTLTIGGLLALAGYSLLYAVVVAHHWEATVVVVALLYCLACSSLSWYDTANIITNVHNFPGQQPVVIGLCKSFSGLGASLFAQAYLGLFSPNTAAFLLALPITAAVIAAGGVCLVNPLPPPAPWERPPRWYFPFLLTLTAGLALSLLAASLAQALLPLPRGAAPAVTAGVAVLLTLYWAVPAHSGACCVPAAQRLPQTPVTDLDDVVGPDFNVEPPTPSVSLPAALRGPAVWLLFLIFGCGTGVGLMLTNNLAQLSVALAGPGHPDQTDQTVLVSLFAVGSALGRLACGAASQASAGGRRTAFLAAAVALQGGVQWLLSFASHAGLFACVPLAGLCYGAYWALMPTICTDLFGVAHLGAIYNFLQCSTSGGSVVFSVLLAGRLYDREAARQGPGTTCYGEQCFRTVFWIATMACGASFLCALLLQLVTRKTYHSATSIGPSASFDSTST